MKKIVILISILGLTLNGHAQILKKIQRKMEDKVEKSVDGILNGKTEEKNQQPNAGIPGTTGPKTAGTFDILTKSEPFIAGNVLLFEDSLNYDTPGRMAKYWQTNSTGTVVEINGAPGKWLKLADQASYQLDTLLHLPQKFTLEFDLLTRASEAKDLRSIDFGFSKNNSTRKYIYGVANETNVYTSLQYYYETINTTSNNNNNQSRIEFPLSNYANAIMHVSVSVDGSRMQVYIDDHKVLDATVLNPQVPKHFFLSTENYRNNAVALISNLRIYGF
ncbi:hypothetical protein [Sphingobacterium corticibacterium]|uniref:Uncharacterized protein n=1 Tax=Sphingobacterium corticibacterium TaxID=2484746 RepID=A0A4Q6XPJ0_9SPHI|nr:hypothetical protein [Sphingobacterium corticibacterium]RZF62130.1 hypothetical protein EWE74_04785 [Sphingobacterium corticibacterium]